MTDRAQETLRRFKAARLSAAFKIRKASDCDVPADCDRDVLAPITAASDGDIQIHGMAVPYDLSTGDGRRVRRGALTWDLATEGVPIIWDREDGDHTGMILGRVDSFRADDSGVYADGARLFASDDPEAKAAVARVVELIAENAIGWSVMMDDEEIEVSYKEPSVTESSDGTVTARFRRDDDLNEVISGRIRHLALVDTPAFPGARPIMGPAPAMAAAAAMAGAGPSRRTRALTLQSGSPRLRSRCRSPRTVECGATLRGTGACETGRTPAASTAPILIRP